MAFSPGNIVGYLFKKRLTKGGHEHPRTPLATPMFTVCKTYGIYIPRTFSIKEEVLKDFLTSKFVIDTIN